MTSTLTNSTIPLDDDKRVEALHRYDILYTPSEDAFDTITQIMAQVFGTSMAFITLVDKDQVFYKAQVGNFGRSVARREDSLCSTTILFDEPMIIEDVSADSSFEKNPFVTCEGGIRFYAGAPLITRDGYRIGSACVVDATPRTFSDSEKQLLVGFSKMVMNDIELRLSAQKEVEVREQLNTAQAQLNSALKAGKVTAWNWDLTQNKVYGGEELARFFFIDPKKAVSGLPVERFIATIHPDDQEYVWAAIIDAIALGHEYETEYRVVNDQQQTRWAISRGIAQYEDGKPVGMTGVLIDSTDKKQSEYQLQSKNNELKDLYQELQFVLDTMPQLVWATDPDGTSCFFNKGWLQYTGLTFDESKGDGWIQALHPNDLDHVIKTWTHAMETGDDYQVEYRLRRYDGAYRWFLVRGTPMKDPEGNILKWYGTTTDIQEHKEASQSLETRVAKRTKELLDANHTLKQLNNELEQFTYVSHHDLQEPIRKIMLFADMIKPDAGLSNTSRIYLKKVSDAAHRMNDALNDILNYASQSRQEEEEEVNLNEVLCSIQTDLELLIAEKKATLMVEPLPTLQSVPHQMYQLFYNLINNALKFSKPDVAPLIKINCRQLDQTGWARFTDLDPKKNYIEISVCDNGIGFDQSYATKIFMMFQRLHSRDTYPGTGIGLALARKVVTGHQGKIWAEGTKGKGAAFRMIFPTP